MKHVLGTEAWEADVLKKLSMLSDGAVANLDANVSQGKPGTKEPRGGSLYEEHEAKLKRLLKASPARRHLAISEAEMDWEAVKYRRPAFDSPDSDENKRLRDAQIVDWLERGWPIIKICVYAGLSHNKDHGKRYVERIRKALREGRLDDLLMV